ncbi:MAG: hypothetical protein BAA01_12330 [Bacillus thermozeamaize]|uniref:Sucrose-6-phosphate hydrolase n=1 Tax=Bacillus thermozeamaize TaxID=230954 RepID=A0A1Y3PK90_9BACI|nr:MAG: hypothetical protein BAA01_12330 [Bacillus thermozeamaize]
MNDPNGFSFFNQEYHLFFQYHPYSSKWGPIHWGHLKSKDLVKWEVLPIALAPDQPYDIDGCFSGSAIEDGGRHVLMYTGHTNPKPDDPSLIRQTVCIAIGDGVTYKKLDSNPVISAAHLPEGASVQDFRDPKLWKKGGRYYAVVGNRASDGSGQILAFHSDNLVDWRYLGTVLRSNHTLGKMWECPDLFELDGKDVLLLSTQFMERNGDFHQNIHSAVYLTGSFDYETGRFEQRTVDQIDFGFDFYAPQTLIDDKGRRILIAWMQMWDRPIPTDVHGHGWAGMMTLPRVLRLERDELYQEPIQEIEHYRRHHVHRHVIFSERYTDLMISGDQIELQVAFKPLDASRFGIKVRKSGREETVMYYETAEERFYLDRTRSGHPIQASPTEADAVKRTVPVPLKNGELSLRIFLDRSSLEIFINGGRRVMSSTIYPIIDGRAIEFFADGKVEMSVDKWDLVVGD